MAFVKNARFDTEQVLQNVNALQDIVSEILSKTREFQGETVKCNDQVVTPNGKGLNSLASVIGVQQEIIDSCRTILDQLESMRSEARKYEADYQNAAEENPVAGV